jgi:hypothetical protein
MTAFPARYLSSPAPATVARWAARHAGPGDTVLALFGEREGAAFRKTAGLGQDLSSQLVAGLFPGVIAGGRRCRSGALLLALPAGAAPSILDLSDASDRADATVASPFGRNGSAPNRHPQNGHPQNGHRRNGHDRNGHRKNGQAEGRHRWNAARRNGQLLNGHGSDAPESVAGAGTLLAFADGRTPNVGRLLHVLRNEWAGGTTVLGGGAGARTPDDGACLMAGGRLLENAAVIVPVAAGSGIGVRHGWDRVAGPLVATTAKGNVLHRLNWEPAADVYRRLLNTHGISGDLSEVGARFPFGMLKQGEEDLIRTPIALEDGGRIVCGGPVPEHSVLHVLSGTARGLVGAAKAASDAARPAEGEGSGPGWFVVEGAHREAVLGPKTGVEIEAWPGASIADSSGADRPHAPGVMTIGQIATTRNGTVDWLNGTTVVGAFQETEVV